MKKQSVSKAAIVATAIFALATGSAWAANNYWAAPGGTGNFTDANWLDPANGTMSTYTYVSNIDTGGVFFTNYTDNVVNLGGQTLQAYAIRTPTATRANPTRIRFENGTITVNVARQMVSDVLNNAEVTLGDGVTYNHGSATGTWGMQLVKNTHFILESGSAFNESSSNQDNLRSQIGYGSQAEAGSSNSLYIASGATATFRRTLQLGTSSNATDCVTGIVHVAGGTFNGSYIWLGYPGGSASTSGRGAFIVDNGGVATLSATGDSISMGAIWKSGGVYNGVSELKIGSDSTFTANGSIQFFEYAPKSIDVDGGTLIVKGSIKAWSNNDVYKASSATVNVHNGGVLEVGGLTFNTYNNNGMNFTVDGGTLRARKSFTTGSAQGNSGKTRVTVGDNGFDFDTQSYDVTWKQGIEGGTGTLRKLGSGSLQLAYVPTFNGAIDVAEGTLKQADGTSLNFPGSITVRDGATFEKTSVSSNPATKNSSFVFEVGATVKPYINAGTPIAIEAASFTFPAEGAVTVDLGSYAPLSGACEILKLTGDSTFSQADLARISVANATLFTDGKTVFASFGSNPSYVWIGGSGNFSDAANWAGGAVPPAATAIDITIFDNGSNVYVTNDITGLTPKSISLVGDAVVHLRGKKMTGLERVNNTYITSAAYRDYITAPIEFAGTMTIGGNMWILFADAKAETIAFDSAASLYAQQGLLGYITLTGDWTPDRALSIQDGTLTVEGMLGGSYRLTVNSSGILKADRVAFNSTALLAGNSGNVEMGIVTASGSGDYQFYNGGATDGIVAIGKFINNAANTVRFNNAQQLVIGDGGFVFGSNTAANQATWKSFSVGGDTTANIWPSANFTFATNSYATTGDPKSSSNTRKDFMQGYNGDTGSKLNVYTTDFYDGSVARTVTVDGCFYCAKASNEFNVRGIGKLIVNSYWSAYPGKVGVYDTATLQINPGCRPGASAVTMAGGTCLSLPLKADGSVATLSVKSFTQSDDLRVLIDGDTLADDEYTLITATSAPSVNTSKILVGGTAVAGKVATVSVDGTSLKLTVSSEYDGPDSIWTGVKDSNLLDPDNWLGGVPTAENGRAAVIGATEDTVFTCDGPFNPTSITFPAGSAKVTISGEGSISGITAITNLSSVVQEFQIPVSGGTVDLYNTYKYCRFAGGFTVVNPVLTNSPLSNSARGMSGDWTITGEGYVTVPYCRVQTDSTVYVTAPMGNGALESLLVSTNATFRAAIVTLPANGVVQSDYIQIGYNNYGTVVFDEVVAESDSAMTRLAFSQAAPGVLRIGKFTNNAKQNVRLNGLTFVMGAGGFGYGSDSSDGTQIWYGTAVGAGWDATIWPSADYTIGLNGNDSRDPKSSSNARMDFGIGYTNDGADSSVLTLYTSDYDDHSVPRKVTIDGVIYSNTSGAGVAGKMRVCGCGEVLFNSYSRFGMGITVEDTATLSVNAGCAPGKGNVTMNSGTTLSLPETGSVTLGGNLALADGSALAFKVAENTNAVLRLQTLTLPESGKVTVKLTADSLPKVGSPYTLTSGAGLTDADKSKFELADGIGGSLSVRDDELVYTPPEYFYIKISESDADGFNINPAWFWAHGGLEFEDTDALALSVAQPAPNGYTYLQNYLLGYEPDDPASKLRIDNGGDGGESGNFTLNCTFNVPDVTPESGNYVVKAKLLSSMDGENFSAVEGVEDQTVSARGAEETVSFAFTPDFSGGGMFRFFA